MKRDYLLLVVIFFFWGSTYVVSRYTFATVPPITLLMLRLLISLLPLYALARHAGFRKVQKQHWPALAIIGAFGYFGALCLQMNATSLLSSGISALVNAMNPVFISLAAVLMLGETMTRRKAVGLVCSIAGVVVVLGVGGGSINPLGIVLSLSSVLVWSVVSCLIRKITAFYPPEQVTFMGMVIASPIAIVASALELQTKSCQFTPAGILSAVYLAVFCTALGNCLWNRSLQRIDASICSQFYPLQPFWAGALGVAFLGEPITLNFVLGGTLICLGVFIGVHRPKAKA